MKLNHGGTQSWCWSSVYIVVSDGIWVTRAGIRLVSGWCQGGFRVHQHVPLSPLTSPPLSDYDGAAVLRDQLGVGSSSPPPCLSHPGLQ